jgi:hypothetical protein
VRWRARCWYLLDDVLYCDNLTPRQKLRSLSELRDLIGDAAYAAGRMPSPIPEYKVTDLWREGSRRTSNPPGGKR